MWTARRVLAGVLCSAVACSAPGDDELDGGSECVGAKCDIPVSDDEVVATTNNNLQLLTGWDFLHDRALTAPCVQTIEGEGKGRPVLVGEPEDTFDMSFMTKREELASQLDLDLSMQGTIKGVGVNSKVQMLNKFASKQRSASYLIRIKSEYAVRHRHPVELSDVGLAAVGAGMDESLRVCGTHFARGMRYGAELYVMITFTAATESQASELKAEVGVDAGKSIPGAELSAGLSSKLVNSANREGISAEISVAARGFSVGSGDDSSVLSRLVNEGVTPETFKSLDSMFTSMKTSVAQDVCRDSGRDDCWSAADKNAASCGGDGEEPCGYYHNDLRQALANGIAPAMHNSLHNWAEDPAMPFKDVLRRMQDNQDYLRSLGELQERMNKVFFTEIRKFMDTEGAAKAEYNLRKGLTPADSLEELVAVADSWEREFLPPTGGSPQIGITYEVVEKEFKDCFQATSDKMLFECGPGDVEALLEDSELWINTETKLEEYHKTGRIIPVRYWSGTDGLVNHGAAESACHDEANFGTSANPIRGRLPTKEEAQVLAPLVGWGNLDWDDTDVRHAIYYSTSLDDGCASGEKRIMVNRPDGDGPEFVCAEHGTVFGDEILPVCVPPDGPIALPHVP